GRRPAARKAARRQDAAREPYVRWAPAPRGSFMSVISSPDGWGPPPPASAPEPKAGLAVTSRSRALLPELEIRGDEARQTDVVERDRNRRVKPDHDVGSGLRHRARQRGVVGEVACLKLQRVVGRAGSSGEIVDRLGPEMAA